MKLHDEPVLKAHASHLRQHLCAEKFGVLGGSGTVENPVEQGRGGSGIEVSRAGAGMAMIGRRRPETFEEGPARAVRGAISRPGRRLLRESA